MFRYSLLSVILLVLSAGLTAQTDYIEADFDVVVDHSKFAMQGGVLLDINLLVPRNAFEFVEDEEGLKADVMFQVALIQGDNVPYGPDRWIRTFRVNDRKQLSGSQRIPDISTFQVLPGDYTLRVDILDIATNKRQQITEEISVELFETEKLDISDITIASVIKQVQEEGVFTKYGFDVVPNADRTFGAEAPLLYYFFEIYNLSGKGYYALTTEVRSLTGKTVQEFDKKQKKMPGTSAVEWGGFNTGGLRSGIYELYMKVKDQNTGAVMERTRKFYIYREGSSKAAAKESSYAGLSEDQLDEIYDLVSIIMNAEEQRLYEKSQVEGKRNVLDTVWERRDPDPSDDVNEFKDDFYQRVQVANKDFSSRTHKGWETDKGRILIKYGAPSNIDQVPSSLTDKPYETWYYYELEGGVEFIFVDKSGFGDYELVHSTARNEIYDVDWQRWLR